jgi:hypothetical protein
MLMSNAPLMPKATAVWLVENTSLTFDQIADFCKLHPLEVKGIADGEVAAGIRGHDPITFGQLSREELAKGEANLGLLTLNDEVIKELARSRNPVTNRPVAVIPGVTWVKDITTAWR